MLGAVLMVMEIVVWESLAGRAGDLAGGWAGGRVALVEEVGRRVIGIGIGRVRGGVVGLVVLVVLVAVVVSVWVWAAAPEL